MHKMNFNLIVAIFTTIVLKIHAFIDLKKKYIQANAIVYLLKLEFLNIHA